MSFSSFFASNSARTSQCRGIFKSQKKGDSDQVSLGANIKIYKEKQTRLSLELI